MDFIYKVAGGGYYTTLEKAIEDGKQESADIWKIIPNQKDDYEEKFLTCNVYGNLVYYTYSNDQFFDLNDEQRLHEEEAKQQVLLEKEFRERKSMTYEHTPDLGWCDYPEQFVEKCPKYTGTIRFDFIERKKRPYYPIVEWKIHSSPIDNYYGDSLYIGNYKFGKYETKFEDYNGKTKNEDGIPYPRIDALWKFQTQKCPLGNFVVNYDITMEVENGKIIKIY